MEPLPREELKAMLLREEERLTRELAAFATKDPRMRDDWDAGFPAGAPLGAAMSHASQDEQADLREEFETAIAQEQSLESRLAEVRRALARMAAGTYGRCLACGEPLPPERLRANPAAAYDMVHQPRE